MSAPLFSYDFVYSDVEPPGSSPWVDKEDLAIPTGMQVVGSGAILTHYKDAGVWTAIDSEPDATVAGLAEKCRVWSGPHPTDSTKWRVMLSQTTSTGNLRFRCWIAVVG